MGHGYFLASHPHPRALFLLTFSPFVTQTGNWEGSEISTYTQISLLQFHGGWQTTQDSWTRDKDQFIADSSGGNISVLVTELSSHSALQGEP